MSYIFIIIAAALWGTTGLFTTYFSDVLGYSAVVISLIRVVFTSLILAVWLLISNKASFKIRLKDIWVFLGSGVFGLTFFTYCYFVSIKMNGVAIAAVLLYTAPAFVTIMSALLFKTHFKLNNILSLFLAISGCVFVSGVIGTQLKITTLGMFLGIGSGFGYALYTIFAKVAINKGYNGKTVAFYTFLLSALATLPIVIFTEETTINNLNISFKLLLVFVCFGLITGALPYIFYNKGLTKTEPSLVAIISTVEPVVAVLLGIFVKQEKITLLSGIGMALILVSLLVGALNTKKVE